jgi:hypothetical protein
MKFNGVVMCWFSNGDVWNMWNEVLLEGCEFWIAIHSDRDIFFFLLLLFLAFLVLIFAFATGVESGCSLL